MYVRGICKLMYSVIVLTNKFKLFCVFVRYYIENFKLMKHFWKLHPGKHRATQICIFLKLQKIFCKEISVSKSVENGKNDTF